MAAGLGFKDFTTGEVLTAADVDGYLMQGIWVFASAAARDAAVTSPQEGNFAFTKDNNSLWYYDGAAWVASGATGDIEGVTAGIGISGGGTSGTVTVTNSMATAIDAKGDLVVGTGADTFSKLTVGANGTTLVADSAEATGLKWATPASGGGMTLLSTTSLTGNSVTISTISGSYKNLYILARDISTSVNDNVNVRLNSDSGSNYSFGRLRITGSTLTGYSNLAETYIETVETHNSSAWNLEGFFEITIPRYAESEIKSFWMGSLGSQNGSTKKSDWRQGSYNSTSAISSVTVYCEAGGTTFGSGTVYVYGVS